MTWNNVAQMTLNIARGVVLTLVTAVTIPTIHSAPQPGSPALSLSKGPATGTSGMVSSAHPLATEAGLKILRSGGNAFDAAVAVAAALNIVEPEMSGMGGYGTILVYDAKSKKTWFLNPSGRIPAAVDSDAFRAPTAGYLENRRGAKSVSTPGNVHAWEAMSKRYGRLKWNRLFAPAIELAANGFSIVMNLVDFGMDVQHALAAPRVSFAEPDVLMVEEAVPEVVRTALAARGHTLRVTRAIGNAHALTIQYGPNGRIAGFTGAADPRGGGRAAGY